MVHYRLALLVNKGGGESMDKAIEQANRVINRYRSMGDQFSALHGILCMDHGADSEQCSLARKFINGMVVAKRLDDIINDHNVNIVGPLFYDNK